MQHLMFCLGCLHLLTLLFLSKIFFMFDLWICIQGIIRLDSAWLLEGIGESKYSWLLFWYFSTLFICSLFFTFVLFFSYVFRLGFLRTVLKCKVWSPNQRRAMHQAAWFRTEVAKPKNLLWSSLVSILCKGVAPLSESWMMEEASTQLFSWFFKNVGKALLSKKEKD